MTGLTILRQAYSLLEKPENAAAADGDEYGLLAVNQIYSELWHREHRTRFEPLANLRQAVALSWRFLPAMTSGTAMLLSLNAGENYTRYQELYRRAASHTGGVFPRRVQTAFPEEVAD